MLQESYISELREQHIDQSAHVITKCFLAMNTIWRKYKPQYDQIYSFIRGKVIPAVASGWSYVLIHKGRVISLCLSYDLLQYLENPSMPSDDLQLFKDLSKAGSKLQKCLDISQLKKGDAIYGVYSVMDPDYANQGFSMAFWWHQLSVGREVGWKYYYSRISSPISLKMLKDIGGQELGSVTVDGEKGPQKIWMVRLKFEHLPTYSALYDVMKMKKKQKKAQTAKL